MSSIFDAVEISYCPCGRELELVSMVNVCACGVTHHAELRKIERNTTNIDLEDMVWE
jgi:hypothetical protein